jgi:hypothetical protein
MTLVSRREILLLATEADRLPEELEVVGLGFIKDAKRVKTHCENCARQHRTDREYIDIDELLADGIACKIHPAGEYAAMLVVNVEKIRNLPHLTEFKCGICGKENVIK